MFPFCVPVQFVFLHSRWCIVLSRTRATKYCSNKHTENTLLTGHFNEPGLAITVVDKFLPQFPLFLLFTCVISQLPFHFRILLVDLEQLVPLLRLVYLDVLLVSISACPS